MAESCLKDMKIRPGHLATRLDFMARLGQTADGFVLLQIRLDMTRPLSSERNLNHLMM